MERLSRRSTGAQMTDIDFAQKIHFYCDFTGNLYVFQSLQTYYYYHSLSHRTASFVIIQCN